TPGNPNRKLKLAMIRHAKSRPGKSACSNLALFSRFSRWNFSGVAAQRNVRRRENGEKHTVHRLPPNCRGTVRCKTNRPHASRNRAHAAFVRPPSRTQPFGHVAL